MSEEPDVGQPPRGDVEQGMPPPPVRTTRRRKIADPFDELPDRSAAYATRVLIPRGAAFTAVRELLAADGIPFREVPYLIEREDIVSPVRDDRPGHTRAVSTECGLISPSRRARSRTDGEAAEAARDAFDLMWDTHAPVEDTEARPVAVGELVDPEWTRYLPYPVFNPAQSETVGHLVTGDDHVIVVAPTGAGKTVIGMLAALRAILHQRRKVVWLVPQRSLTDELDRELDVWRAQGLGVERLSGEYSVDVQRVRRADVWVATTEKFEAICRASSFREALDEVGCVVADEVHLLGDPVRGPVLEALLARMRTDESKVRVVGLSATVSNAAEVADWLGARLVRISWRPSRVSWQLPMIPSSADWNLTEANRTRLAAAITRMITGDGGSVIVFCGSKRNVRRTALFIAAGRGADVRGVHPDDLDRLHEVCRSVGVGLHYKGWEHRKTAEQSFRTRQLDTLVATSTVAAGVNLPARAVVVRDTQVGLDTLDVATVQQMFGRAGRVGTGEAEGSAFLIVDENERAAWQTRLVAGYTVRSQILASLADHLLAEVVQRRVGSVSDAEEWWVHTLAHYQGSRSPEPLRKAVEFLSASDYVTVRAEQDDSVSLVPTDLGLLTARMMVPVDIGHALRAALSDAAVPADPDAAERLLIDLLCPLVPRLAQAVPNEDLKPRVTRLLLAGGRIEAGARQVEAAGAESLESPGAYGAGDLARATLLAVANSPTAFRRSSRLVAGIPYAAMYPILEDAPRYLHWLGAQGMMGTVRPWSAIVAADLSRRVRWRRCAPPRGAGRLLWMCEQMASPAYVEEALPDLWEAARSAGVTSPDWSSTTPPRGCRLEAREYLTLLQERATGVRFQQDAEQVSVRAPAGSVLVRWSGTRCARALVQQGRAALPVDDGDEQARQDESSGVAVFTRRGDHAATGWLAAYAGIGRDETYQGSISA